MCQADEFSNGSLIGMEVLKEGRRIIGAHLALCWELYMCFLTSAL
jgi:hypothetical protein